MRLQFLEEHYCFKLLGLLERKKRHYGFVFKLPFESDACIKYCYHNIKSSFFLPALPTGSNLLGFLQSYPGLTLSVYFVKCMPSLLDVRKDYYGL